MSIAISIARLTVSIAAGVIASAQFDKTVSWLVSKRA